MKKIGFIIPWFGRDIPGGAEAALRDLTEHLKEKVEVEILTTCVKEFGSDWNVDYYKPGDEIINDIVVKRFKVRKRDSEKFAQVNYKLMNHIAITKVEETIFVNEMVNSPLLYEYMKLNKDNYSLFVFTPYMFGTTYFGSMVAPEKSVLIPCFHNESYAYLDIFKKAYSKVAGIIYYSKPECELANKIYDLSEAEQVVLGAGIDTDIDFNEGRFRKKYKIFDPFILYVGRKDVGKNVDTLLKYFMEYKKRNQGNLKLILLGGGEINIPDIGRKDILDLGFIARQDKYDACHAAELLCQPSKNESFSLVIMESWLCEKPVLVHGDCDVTKNFVIEAAGGLYFTNYYEFEMTLNYIMENTIASKQMSYNGKKYAVHKFCWDSIINKYIEFFEKLIKQSKMNE